MRPRLAGSRSLPRAQRAPLVARFGPQKPANIVPKAAAGGGGIGGNRTGGGGGGDGGDNGGGDGASGSGSGKGGWEAFPLVAGWKSRVAADPEFPFKMLLEQVIGVSASVVGDMSSRPNWGINELDFVFATAVVCMVINFSIMYLLAPTAAVAGGAAAATAAAAGGGGIVQRLLSDEFLKKWGAPGGNMFEPGFSVPSRLVNFAYKGVIFSVIGLLAGIVGTSISNGLLSLRQKLDPSFVSQNEPPNILGNAACWSLQMGVSSNLRYQLLGGTDVILVKAMPQAAFRLYSAVIRAANNVLGGMTFVLVARALGVQKATEPAPALAKA
ncbi:MAG: hypothetical protein J3K34DRAFT_427752 [Monoraphidium minutum]|nr:MAG: hypothetical protein J3K34DRAFT_427752 [Monoraphidium minutum]